jgi:hypothetical protein
MVTTTGNALVALALRALLGGITISFKPGPNASNQLSMPLISRAHNLTNQTLADFRILPAQRLKAPQINFLAVLDGLSS